jgi:proteasome lid subunit RPN8/RPN11
MLRINAADFEAIRGHGEETYPNECCGILIGKSEAEIRSVQSTIRCTNTRTDSAHSRYQIDPHELVRAQRQARDRGLDIVGFYHSHPDHPAQWSRTDLEEAHWIGCSYVITTIEKGRATVTRSFVLAGTTEEDKAFVEEDVIIEADDDRC